MPPGPGIGTQWIDVPAKYHGNACGFTFLDGHSVIHKWFRPQAIPDVTFVKLTPGSQPINVNNPDVWWVASHTSTRADGAGLLYYVP